LAELKIKYKGEPKMIGKTGLIFTLVFVVGPMFIGLIASLYMGKRKSKARE